MFGLYAHTHCLVQNRTGLSFKYYVQLYRAVPRTEVMFMWWLWLDGDFDDFFHVNVNHWYSLLMMMKFLLNLAPEPEPEPEPEMAEYQGSLPCGLPLNVHYCSYCSVESMHLAINWQLSVCLPVCRSVCRSFCLPACLSDSLLVGLSVCLSTSLSSSLSVGRSVCLPPHGSACLSACQSVYALSIQFVMVINSKHLTLSHWHVIIRVHVGNCEAIRVCLIFLGSVNHWYTKRSNNFLIGGEPSALSSSAH